MFGNTTWNDTFGWYNESGYHGNVTNIEKIVSMMVPVFFGLIGLAGLIGNGLVVLGKCKLVFPLVAYLLVLIIGLNVYRKMEITDALVSSVSFQSNKNRSQA